MLLHFYTMGFISTSQHFCPSQSLKTMMIQDALDKTPWHAWILDLESRPGLKFESHFKRDLKTKYSGKAFP